MTETCPSCGYLNPDAARFCTRCGAPLKGVGTQQTTGHLPTQPQIQGSASPLPLTQQPQAQATAYTQADIDGLKKLKAYALLSLVGIVLSVVSPFLFNLRRLVVVSPTPPQTQYPSFTVNPVATGAFVETIIIGVVGVAIAILAFILLYQGFVAISRVDVSLRTPARLLLLLPVGLFIVIIGLAFVLRAVTIAQPQPVDTAYSGLIASGALLILVSLILSLVGAIGGEILGLWRVGARYGESLIQIGGILLIIPLLNIIAPILVYMGSSSALAKVYSNTTVAGTNQAPYSSLS